MRKLIALILCLMLCLPTSTAFAESKEREVLTSGYFDYVVLNDGTAEIVKYTGEGENPTIPERLDGWKVTSIGDCAFNRCDSLISITIPDGVTSIGDEAFSLCSNLTAIEIPDSVTSIGDYAFSSCEGLTSVTIPDSVTSMGANPFLACKKLTSIMVSPDHPVFATIDGVLFNKEDKCLVCYPFAFTASTYSIPDGIRIIGEQAFAWNVHLTSVAVPGSVTSIGDCAFSFCYSLTSITIPGSVTSIGGYVFFWCFNLTSITIPSSMTRIGDYAFAMCSSLTSIKIPDSVTRIGGNAFADCNANLKITVGRGSYAAEYCKANGLNYTYPDINDWLKD